jgi:hypothetical protein
MFFKKKTKISMKRSSSSSSSAPPAKKKKVPGLPALKKNLALLDKKQLTEMLVALASLDNVGIELVSSVAPPADIGKVLKELQQKVNAIFKAQGRYANNDQFCWNRAKSKVRSAKAALVAAANRFRKAKTWSVALDFATGATRIAEEMPDWSFEGADNTAKAAALKTLSTLAEDAETELAK